MGSWKKKSSIILSGRVADHERSITLLQNLPQIAIWNIWYFLKNDLINPFWIVNCEILKNEISMNKKNATEGLPNKSYDLSMGHFRIILKQCAWKEPGNFLGYPGASFPMDLWLLLLIESNHRQELDRI